MRKHRPNAGTARLTIFGLLTKNGIPLCRYSKLPTAHKLTEGQMETKSYDISEFMDPSPNTMHLLIVRQFRQMIMDGLFKEGDKLPSERELATMLSVSRIPVRESLKVLEFLGIVRRRRGRMTLGHLSFEHVLDFFDFLLCNPMHTMEEMFETREALECQAAILAARRHTKEDLEALSRAISDMEKSLEKDSRELGLTQNFHSLIVQAAHNRVLFRVFESLYELITFSRKEILKDPKRREIEFTYHKSIYERIAARDEEGAARAMREHMRAAMEHARKRPTPTPGKGLK
jgi:GntR family transcriptional repressor for pyruvate dehydrogenase complex